MRSKIFPLVQICLLVASTVLLSALTPGQALADTPVAITSPIAGQAVGAGALTISGVAANNTAVSVSLDSKSVGIAMANGSGNWSIVDQNVAAGKHTITAQAETPSGDPYAFMANSEEGTIDVVDVVTHNYVHEILDVNSVGATYDSANNTVYSAGSDDSGNCEVQAINPDTYAISAAIAVEPGCFPVSITLSPDQQTAYMLYNTDGGTYLAAVNTATNTLTGTHDISSIFRSPPSGIAVSPDGSTLWVREELGVDSINLPSFTYGVTLSLNLSSSASQNLVFNADGSKLYTGDSSNGMIYIVKTSDDSISNFYVGDGVGNLAFTPDFTKLYAIEGYPTTGIVVINPTNNSVIDSQTTTANPESLAISNDGQNFVVGDDHGSGGIYFGAVSGNASVTNTIYAPEGGGFFTYTGNFVTDGALMPSGDPVSLTFSAVGAPDTGTGRAANGFESYILLIFGLAITGLGVRRQTLNN